MSPRVLAFVSAFGGLVTVACTGRNGPVGDGNSSTGSPSSSSERSCGDVRDALDGLDTRWPHRVRTFHGTGSPPLTVASLGPGRTVERVPPERTRDLDEVVIGGDVFRPDSGAWRRYDGPAPGAWYAGSSAAIHSCTTDGSRPVETIRFRVRLSARLEGTGELVLDGGKPIRYDIDYPLLAGLVGRESHRFEHEPALRIEAPTPLASAPTLQVECSIAEDQRPTGRVVVAEASFAVTIPAGFASCGLPMGLVRVPLRRTGERQQRGYVQVNEAAFLFSSMDDAINTHRLTYQEHVQNGWASDWSVDDTQAGSLPARRIRFEYGKPGKPLGWVLTVAVVEREEKVAGRPVFDLISFETPRATLAEDEPVFSAVLASFEKLPRAAQ